MAWVDMMVLFATLCLAATALAATVEGGPSLIEPFSRHLHGVPADGRTYGGDNANIAGVPYQAALYDEAKVFFCSGGIISDEWIVTAAHCVDQITGNIEVRAAFLKLSKGADNGEVAITTPADRTVHKNFDIDFLDNDIALIRVTAKLTKPLIKPLVLPTYADAAKTLVGVGVRISGWGTVKAAKQDTIDHLQYADIALPDAKQCEDAYGNVVIGTKGCAITSTNAKSVCTGDSGAPVVQVSHEDILVGILSFGSSEGCTAGKPIVFTRVSSFLEFIGDTTGIVILDNPADEPDYGG